MRSCAVPVQATAGTDGQVLLFDTALFQEGTILSPFAKIQAAPAGSEMLHLAWTSGAPSMQHLIKLPLTARGCAHS